MKDAEALTGVVLSAQPYSEFDKRLVLLTRERGRITAFARGARRVNSPFLAVANPFVFGEFSVYAGRSAYNLAHVKPVEFFRALAAEPDSVCYGFYFLELAGFFSQENLEAAGVVDLLYVSFRALEKGAVPRELIRRIFECRLMVENGIYAPPEARGDLDESAYYALRLVCTCPMTHLFSFRLTDEAQADFFREVRKSIVKQVPVELRSARILEEMTGV